MDKVTILVDMDGVVAAIHDYWLDEINKELGTSFMENDIWCFETHRALKTPEKLTYKFLDEPGFFFRAKVVEDSQDVLCDMWRHYNMYICSAASYSNYAVKEKWLWLQKYFPFITKERVIFTKDKSMIRGDYLIDDALHNIETFPGHGIIFDKPWNRNDEYLDASRTTRVKNWNEIKQLFL